MKVLFPKHRTDGVYVSKLAVIAAFAASLIFFGCGGGGGGGGGGGNNVSVSISPTSATVGAGGSKSFSATVTNAANANVSWSVVEGSAGGSVTTGGLYVAPLATGVFHVKATSQEDPTKSDIVAVTVTVSVAVHPINPGMTLSDTQTFTATVYGSADTAVTWSIQEGAAGGTINAAGSYTAPKTPGTYHVIATSHADPAQSGSTTIVVSAGSANGTIQ